MYLLLANKQSNQKIVVRKLYFFFCDDLLQTSRSIMIPKDKPYWVVESQYETSIYSPGGEYIELFNKKNVVV